MELPKPDDYPMWSDFIGRSGVKVGRHNYRPDICEETGCRFLPRENYSQDIRDYPRIHIGQMRGWIQ